MTATDVRPAPADEPPVSGGRPRLAALDGLRALAVAAVVVYHADESLLRGGFVGVDVFFALSGYLITTLLLDERRTTGSVSLRSFWKRRIRRLWPLAWIVLALVAIAGMAGWWGPDREAELPGETLAALANVANWWQAAHGGYVESFLAPSPLRHFWSLAVEEQFYVLWPIIVVGLAFAGSRFSTATGRDRARSVAAALWIGSLVLFAASAVSAWFTDPSTAYLATHTRAVGPLAGAALALALRRRPLAGPLGLRARSAVRVWALVGTIVVCAVAGWGSPEAVFLHRGGFALVAVASAGLVAVALVPGLPRRLLSLTALVWVGRRSYAIYLVHWPLVVLMGPARPAWQVLAVVVPGSVLLAAALHRIVERPVMAGAVPMPRLAATGVVVLALTAGALWVGQPVEDTPSERVAATLERVADPTAPPSGDPLSAVRAGGRSRGDASLDAAEGSEEAGTGPAAEPATTTVPCSPTTSQSAPEFGGTEQFDYATVAEVADPATTCDTQVRVLVLGDSLGRGASNGLVSLGDPRLLLWDRTQLGCSFGPEKCADWREPWGVATLGVQPDVVVVFSRVLGDLKGVDDAPFLSPEGAAQRVAVLTEAAQRLSSTGAKVVFVNAAVPGRPNGLYYCQGKARSSPCDPEWVTEWNRSIAEAAAATGAQVVDAGGWTAARSATDREDRPDGLHFSGQALREYAAWLLPQILTTAGVG